MKIFLTIALITSFAAYGQSAESPYEELRKDLRIFSKILTTSFGVEDEDLFFHHNRKRDSLVPEDIEYTYLRDQGVVLTIDLGLDDSPFASLGRYRVLNRDIGFRFPELYVWSDSFDFDMDSDSEEHQAEQVEAVREMMEDAFDASKEMADMLREAMVDASEAFQMGMSEEHRTKLKKIQQEYQKALRQAREEANRFQRDYANKNKLSEEERIEAESRIKEYQNRVREMLNQNLANIQDIRNENQEKWEEKLAAFEGTLIDAICDYGGSLNSLPDDEHVTLVLQDADLTEEGSRDRIYVFTKADLIACRNGSITKDSLLQKGRAYAF